MPGQEAALMERHMNSQKQDDSFADINEQLSGMSEFATEGGQGALQQLEEVFIERIYSSQDGSFKNIRRVKNLPSAFVATAIANNWPRWSEEQSLVLTNMLVEGVAESDYIPFALAIAAAVALVDGRSGSRMLARLEGRLLSGKKKLKRYHGQVRRCFLEDGALAFYSISKVRDTIKGDVISVGRQFVHACFLTSQDQKQGLHPEVQHDVLKWLVSSDLLLPFVKEHLEPIQSAVQCWPLKMAPGVLALNKTLQEINAGCDLLAHIIPSLQPDNAGHVDRLPPTEADAHTDALLLSPEDMLEGLASYLRQIKEENNSLEQKLSSALDELRRLTEKSANEDSERLKTKEMLADTDRRFRSYRKEMEKNVAKLRDRNKACVSAQAKAEREADSLKEQLTLGEKRFRDLECRMHESEGLYKDAIAQVSERVDAESKHAAEELRRAIFADLDADFRELQHLGHSEETKIASIMLERIFRKLARNGIKFDKTS